jgi:hypothetical protein
VLPEFGPIIEEHPRPEIAANQDARRSHFQDSHDRGKCSLLIQVCLLSEHLVFDNGRKTDPVIEVHVYKNSQEMAYHLGSYKKLSVHNI